MRPSEQMRKLGVRQKDDAVLREPSRPFMLPAELDEARALAARLIRVADQAAGIHVFGKGIGLAAPQIGVARGAAIVRLPEAAPLILLNPRIVEESAESDEQYEGCLSFFDVRGLVPRPTNIVVEYTDVDAANHVTRFERGAARLIYHEIDHLQGMLYTDRMAPGQTPIPISRYHGTGAPWDY
jgi:peptide deformylase